MMLPKKYISFLIVGIFFSIQIYAQVSEIPFRGGDHDGHSSSIRNNLACLVGAVLSPFSGGDSDGSGFSILINEACPAGLMISPFSGGEKEGFAISQLIEVDCPAGLSVSLYSGGYDDGFASWLRVQNNCDGLNSTIISVSPLEVCVGDSILITGTSLSDVDYVQFNDAFTNQFMVIDSTQIRSIVPLGAISGPVTVTGPNGTVSSPQEITITPVPFANFTFEQSTGLSFNFTSLSPSSSTHNWNFGDGNTSQDVNPAHTYAVEGVYDVTLQVSNECGDDLEMNELTAIHVGLSSFHNDNLKIYPNPSKGLINIEIHLSMHENVRIDLYNMMGQKIGTWIENESRDLLKTIDMNELPSGIYFFNIQTDHLMISRKVVKQ